MKYWEAMNRMYDQLTCDSTIRPLFDKLSKISGVLYNQHPTLNSNYVKIGLEKMDISRERNNFYLIYSTGRHDNYYGSVLVGQFNPSTPSGISISPCQIVPETNKVIKTETAIDIYNGIRIALNQIDTIKMHAELASYPKGSVPEMILDDLIKIPELLNNTY